LNLRLKTTAAERAFDPAVRVEQRLRSDLLRAGPFDARDDAERDRFIVARGFSEGLEDDVFQNERVSSQ
jgi:hypothetical protein